MCPTTIFLFKKTILTALQSKVEAPGYISSCNFLLLHDHTKNMCMCVYAYLNMKKFLDD